MAKNVAKGAYTVKGLNRALRTLPKECSARLRDASVLIAGHVADRARDRAIREGHAAKLVAPTIKASRDRVPVVKMGGTKRLPPRNGKARGGEKATIGNLIWGAEFGGRAYPTTQQFQPWRGKDNTAGYFLYPAIRQHAPDTQSEYSEALDDALQAI